MVAIALDVHGQKQTLRSCSHCDLRLWEADGGATTLNDVLDTIAQGEAA